MLGTEASITAPMKCSRVWRQSVPGYIFSAISIRPMVWRKEAEPSFPMLPWWMNITACCLNRIWQIFRYVGSCGEVGCRDISSGRLRCVYPQSELRFSQNVPSLLEEFYTIRLDGKESGIFWQQVILLHLAIREQGRRDNNATYLYGRIAINPIGPVKSHKETGKLDSNWNVRIFQLKQFRHW